MQQLFWFVNDDAFISFRYARNWVDGLGLVFNPGENPPVEGYSNLLWTILAAAPLAAGLDPVEWMPRVSAACGLALAALLYVAARRRLNLPPAPALLGAAAAAWSAPFGAWSTSGLETMPFALLIFVLIERTMLRPAGPAGWTAGLAAAGLALIRAEGAYWAAVLLLLAAATHMAGPQRWVRAWLTSLSILVVTHAAHLAWRWMYYGALVSESTRAKSGLSLAWLDRGLDYVVVQTMTCPILLLALLCLPLALLRPERRRTLALAAATLGFPMFAVLAGGDFMCFGRFLVPALAPAGVLLALALASVGGRSRTALARLRRGAAHLAGAGVVALGVLPGFDVHVVPKAVREKFHFRLSSPKGFQSEAQQWATQRDNAIAWTLAGLALRQVASPGDSVCLVPIGAIGYYSNLRVLDQVGLINPAVARRPINHEKLSMPGHDRAVVPTFFISQGERPTYLLVDMHNGLSLRDFALRMGRHWSDVRRAGGPLRAYYVDFAPIAVAGLPPEPRRVLIYWKRIPEGADPQSAWRQAEQHARAYITGRETPVVWVEPPPHLRWGSGWQRRVTPAEAADMP